MLKRFVRLFGGDPNKRKVEKFSSVVDEINALEPEFEALTDEALREKTAEFRRRLDEALDGVIELEERNQIEKEILDELLPEAFAVVREASKRNLGLRHYDVQLIGGQALHQGKIAEMRTGEGKTLVATLPLYLNALTRRGVHLVTVNDYLARRDARWMAPIFNSLGLSVGVLQMAARTENGKKAFLVDLAKESPHEDQHQMRLVPRAEAYQTDIVYGTNSEFGFDYLRDNMTMSLGDRVQRGHYFAIVDEVDNVLIDEARTPLIISGPAQDEAEWYIRMAQVVKGLRPEDYEINEKDKTVTLTEIGEAHVEDLLGMALRDPDRPEDVSHEQERLLGYLEQALRATYLYRRNKDYLVQAGKVVIVDEFTGRLMPGRRWSDGLHQAVEAKEGVRVQSESVTYATITIQNYFRMYHKLAGMTGTALTESEEFDKIYKLDVVAIPTNLEYQAMRTESGLVEQETKDDQGYKYSYYSHREDPQRLPVYWRRKDYPDIVFRTEEIKLRSIAQEIWRYHVQGRPLLVGTTSVELSERVSSRLKAEPLRRLAQILLLRDAWLQKNNREEDGRQIPELQHLYGQLDQLEVGDLRRMARELEIPFNPEDPANVSRLLAILDLSPQDRDRLVADLQAGIPHQVLNARKHTEESQIIAGAGAFGAVTIATNMAGRGVDIRLGGELAEEILIAVARVLRRAGHKDPYDMNLEERRQALSKILEADYGIYDAEIHYFLQYLDDMERVRKLGGLHVIGSERHEARRIDNQLRGRAARQGDPGSSRFYLSMEDELMRLFGGQQADNLMQRLKIDDGMPLEMGLVGRIVESSQTRVEGSNFDVRKHLLEYDDVLNTQRTKIYHQRDRIFVKDDLSEDVTEMLRSEVIRRIPQALQDEEGPWKLLAWLDSVQPSFNIGGMIFPTYSLRLIADHILGEQESLPNSQAALHALIEAVRKSLDGEEQHILDMANHQIEVFQDRLDSQLRDHKEALDTFMEGLDLSDETDTRRPAELYEELKNILHLPVKLTPDEQRALRENPSGVEEIVRGQVVASLAIQTVGRLVGAIERRMEESLELNAPQLANMEWPEIRDGILGAIRSVFNRRRERLIGNGPMPDGQIVKELEAAFGNWPGPVSRNQLLQLILMIPQGARASFDRKTHRRVWMRTNRLTYLYYADRFLENLEPDSVAEDVLSHLEKAQEIMRQAWGGTEWGRLASVNISDLSELSRRGLYSALGEDVYQLVEHQLLGTLTGEERLRAIDELGRQRLTEIYRELLLRVITDLWVDYLTQVEALRVSISLEAYAQRDPLVQYKNRAYELFQNLLSDISLGVVSRMFTYQPRDPDSVQVGSNRPEVERETRETIPEIQVGDAGVQDEAEVEVVQNEPILENSATAFEAEQETADGSKKGQQSGSGPRTSKRRRRRH